MHTLEMLINGVRHSGFIGGTLTRSLDAPASSFSLRYSPSAVETGNFPIEAGDRAALYIDGALAVTGFVDSTDRTYKPDRIDYSVQGRSLTADLVDCACMARPRAWANKTLAQIVTDVVEPFECDAEIFGDTNERFEKFRYKAGDNALEVIRKAAGMRGMFLFDTPEGNLLVARVGADSSNTRLERGVNLVEASRREDWTQRFSEYHFCGQTTARDDLTGKAGTQLRGDVEDPTLVNRGRFRPFVVIRNGAAGTKDLGKRAVLERNQRAGRSETVDVTVNGWTDGNSDLWVVGNRVAVYDDWLGVDGTMVVKSAMYTFEAEDQAYETRLSLAWAEAFDEVNYPTRGRGDVWR